jgi:hypothetical protein
MTPTKHTGARQVIAEWARQLKCTEESSETTLQRLVSDPQSVDLDEVDLSKMYKYAYGRGYSLGQGGTKTKKDPARSEKLRWEREAYHARNTRNVLIPIDNTP